MIEKKDPTEAEKEVSNRKSNEIESIKKTLEDNFGVKSFHGKAKVVKGGSIISDNRLVIRRKKKRIYNK